MAIDWTETDVVHVDLRRESRYDPDPYTVTLQSDGTCLNAWGAAAPRDHDWPMTLSDICEEAARVQRKAAGEEWSPVLVQVDSEIVWRASLGLDIGDDYERALQEAGLTTFEDVRRCDDLTTIDGIGDVGADQIREAMEAA